jgi:hypothetical protein
VGSAPGRTLIEKYGDIDGQAKKKDRKEKKG